MTNNTPEREAYTPEEIDKALESIKFTPDIVPVDRLKKLMRKYLQANRQPKARPAFVGNDVSLDGTKVCAQRVNEFGEALVTEVFSMNNPKWVRPSGLTHPDGAPVSKVYAPIPDTIHESQLVSFDELEDGSRRYLIRDINGKWFLYHRSGAHIKQHPLDFPDCKFLPLPIVEGNDE